MGRLASISETADHAGSGELDVRSRSLTKMRLLPRGREKRD